MSGLDRMSFFGGDNISPAFGIDLGTTNSAISVVKHGIYSEIIKLNKKDTIPSCVEWLGGDNFRVGWDAYKNKMEPNVAYSVKRIIGSDKKVTLTYKNETREFTPEFISSLVLKELVKYAEVDYGKVKDVVITVPAYFNQNQIEATIKAGNLAGLNVLTTFSEPTSASLLFNANIENMKKNKIVVFDLGGGTFDVSLLEIKKKASIPEIDKIYGFQSIEDKDSIVFRVLGTGGDTRLGGDDIDDNMLNLVLNSMKAKGLRVDLMSRVEIEKLRFQLEQYKKKNPMDIECRIEVNGEKEEFFISKKLFEMAVKPVYDKTKRIMSSVLKGFDKSDIDQIVLVGGSTKSIFIRKFLEEDYSDIPISSGLNPDLSVALGAGLEAKRQKFGDSKIQVFNALPITLGILMDDKVEPVIYQNQVLPYSKMVRATTFNDNQSTIRVEVYQGNSKIPEECVNLGSLVIDGIPEGKAGTVPIYIYLSVNAEGVLKCRVKVHDKEEEKTLVNLFSGNDNNELENLNPRLKKQVVRWSRIISKMDKSKREEGMKLIDKLKNGLVKDTEVAKFISENKPNEK